MDLILWRHAHAVTLADEGNDSDRKLSEKGKKQALKMARWLDSLLPQHCKILVSPTQRTLQTANALGRKYKIMADVGSNSTALQIVTASQWPRDTVLIIGHQPQLGEVVSLLMPELRHCNIRKGNVWWLSQRDEDETPTTFLKAVMTPELVVN